MEKQEKIHRCSRRKGENSKHNIQKCGGIAEVGMETGVFYDGQPLPQRAKLEMNPENKSERKRNKGGTAFGFAYSFFALDPRPSLR